MKISKCIKAAARFLLGTFMICCLAACGAQKATSTGSTSSTGKELTRAQYIGLLGEVFGFDNYQTQEDIFSDVSATNDHYNMIQACAEWNVIDSEGQFRPQEMTTLEFAVVTAARAIAMDSPEETKSSEEYVDFYLNNIAKLDTSDLGSGVAEDVGRTILEYAHNYYVNAELPQVVDIYLAEGVKEAKGDIMLPMSGDVGVITDGADYQVGDIVYWESGYHGLPRSVRITGIEDNHFTFEDVSVTETYSQMEFSGTFEGEILNVYTASEDVSAGGEDMVFPDPLRNRMGVNNGYAFLPMKKGVKADFSSKQVVFTANLDGCEVKVGIDNIRVTGEYKHATFNVFDPKAVSMTAQFDTFVRMKDEFHESATIPLGEVDIKICGPFFARLSLVANLGADGEVSLDYTVKHTATVGWKSGCGITKSYSADPSATAEGEITLTAEVTALADLRVCELIRSDSIANIQGTTGVVIVAKADIDILGDNPDCVDVFGYVPLRWGVNQKGCILTSINSKWQYRAVIWDSTNSGYTIHMHYEDGVRVPDDKCTRGGEKAVLQDNTQENGQPLDEYALFDFEPIQFDFIKLKEYVVFLDESESKEIGFESIPEGCTKDELVYSVEDPEICSIAGGKITSKNPGSTVVKISSEDGMFSVFFTVVVSEDYSLEDEFHEL